MDPEKRVAWVYASKTNDELVERYKSWAADYDTDLSSFFDYQAHTVVAAAFAAYVSADAHILDAGAGTGLVGVALADLGYQLIEGIDMSAEMLAQAEKKGVYRRLKTGVLGQRLDYEDDGFDAIISAGVFTEGHAPAAGFDDLLRILKPGGHIVFTLNDLLDVPDGEFPLKMQALIDEARWVLVEKGPLFQSTPIGEPHVRLRVWVYRKL